MSSSRGYSNLFRWVQIAAVSLLAARAWQHFFKHLPYRDFFWDERWLGGFVQHVLGMDWSEYLYHPGTDRVIFIFSTGAGWLLILACGVALAGRRAPRWSHGVLLAASGLFLFMAILAFKESSYQIAQLMEYGLQIYTPLFFWQLLRGNASERWLRGALLAVALTFVGHGLYAIGWYHRPGHFYVMIMNGLGVDKQAADHVLLMAGILDFAAALLLIFPGRARLLGLAYCAAWGLATSLARLVGNYYPDLIWDTLSAWTYQVIYRLPHFFIPLALLLFFYDRYQRKRSAQTAPSS